MRYPYYNPNLNLTLAIKAIFVSKKKARESIVTYFKKITNKEYVLITNSCRTALYLAYNSIKDTGEVITSPLTCKVAIDPIIESGNKPVFTDVNIGDLNIKVEDIEQLITKHTIAIQAIHLGGVSCDMSKINAIARTNKLLVIEDCAQSMGAKYEGKFSGSFGDISCFTLSKNAFGIGGGILATNSEQIFRKALALNEKFSKVSAKLTNFRFIRNIFETYRKNIFGQLAIKLLLLIKGKYISYQSVRGQLCRISSLQLKVIALQLLRINALHDKRKNIGATYYHFLKNNGILFNSNYDEQTCSFTKFFIYNPGVNTKEALRKLSKIGIEAMHMEHKKGSPYQKRIVTNKNVINGLNNYSKIHDSVISIPINEDYNQKEIDYILNVLYNFINEKQKDMV